MLVCQLSVFVERVSLKVAVKCDCFVVLALRDAAFIPLLNFFGSQNNGSTLSYQCFHFL